MGKYLKNSVLYTIYLFGASLLSLLISAIPLYITKVLTGSEYIQTFNYGNKHDSINDCHYVYYSL